MSEKYNQMNEQNNQGQIPMGIPCNFPTQNVQYGQQPHHQQNQQQPIYHQQPRQPEQYIQQGLSPQLANNQLNRYLYSYPTKIVCPCCKFQVTTVVVKEPGNTTYLWSLACLCCCSLSFCAPCCLVPFLIDPCLDKNHYCSNCGFNILRKHQQCFEFCG